MIRLETGRAKHGHGRAELMQPIEAVLEFLRDSLEALLLLLRRPLLSEKIPLAIGAVRSFPFGEALVPFSCVERVNMMRTWLRGVSVGLAAALISAVVAATGFGQVPMPSPMKADGPPPPEHVKILQDAKAVEGVIPLFQKGNSLFAELSASNYGTEYIVLISIARGIGQGPLLGGMSWGFGDDWVWTFRKVDDRVFIVRKNVRFKAAPGSPEASAVKNAYTDSVMFSLQVITKGPKGGDLVDLTQVFMSDLPQIQRAVVYASEEHGGVFGRRLKTLSRLLLNNVPWSRALEKTGFCRGSYERLSARLAERFGAAVNTSDEVGGPLRVEMELERMLSRLSLLTWIVLFGPVFLFYQVVVIPVLIKMVQEFDVPVPPVLNALRGDFSMGWISGAAAVVALVMLMVAVMVWFFPRLTLRWPLR